MYSRRTGATRDKSPTFQQMFKSQNTSFYSKLRYLLFIVCLLVIGSIIIYQMYYINNSFNNKHISSPHESPIQSFMNNKPLPPQHSKTPQQSEGNMNLNGNNDNNHQLSNTILNKLSITPRPQLSDLVTTHISVSDIAYDLIPYSKLSWEEECESSSFESQNYYNYLINEDNIDFVFPSNDKDLYRILNSDEFLFHWDTSFLTSAFWDFLAKLDSTHVDDVNELKLKYSTSSAAGYLSERSRLLGFTSNAHKLFDFNGLTSDYQLYSKSIESVGNNNEYWYTSRDCIQHKSCSIYSLYRILHASKIISCSQILTDILPQLYDCVAKKGKKCKNVIDSGYYRIIMKAKYNNENIVIKMMKPKSIKKKRDLIRHIRESILLTYLYEFEQDWIKLNENDADADPNAIFYQSLNNGINTRKRGFNYVEEYGHCVTPLWISISPLYKIPLDKWILSGEALNSKLSKLIYMSLQIALSVELIHSIPGGPFHHTDIQPRQFLLDWKDNVYINDFNRGKFQPYYFGDDNNGKVEKCWYCGHRSRGHWRAPEEPKKRPLNEKLDIFSMGLTIWSLFSNDIPFKDASFEELAYIYYDLRRIPQMTSNTPPAIKDIIILCLHFEPRLRPTATKIVNMFKDIYYSKLDIITEGFSEYTSKQLLDANTWTDTNYPPLSKRDELQKTQKNDNNNNDDDDDDNSDDSDDELEVADFNGINDDI